MEPLELWWAQAGPARFIKKIIAGIAERRRVLCLTTPVPRPTGLANAIKDKLRSELSFDCAIVDLSTRDQSGSIVHLLAEPLLVVVVRGLDLFLCQHDCSLEIWGQGKTA